MPQRAKSIEEKKAGAVNRVTRLRARRRAAANDLVAPAETLHATGIPPATVPSAVDTLAIVPSAVLGEASSSNPTDDAPILPSISGPELPDLQASADELDDGLDDTLEQLEGLVLTAG